MNKTLWFFAFLIVSLGVFVFLNHKSPENPVKPPVEPPISPVEPSKPIIPDSVGLQVQIAQENRVFNKSGSQCVWCSIECLGRHHGVKVLYEGDTRITKKYTWATGSGEVKKVLSTKYPTVKWTQLQNRTQMRAFIKKYVVEKKFGIGLGIPHHMLNLVHYDEQKKMVKIIDNSSRSLQVQEWSMAKFDKLAEGWVLTVFPPGYSEETNYPIEDPDKLYGFNLLNSIRKSIPTSFLDS